MPSEEEKRAKLGKTSSANLAARKRDMEDKLKDHGTYHLEEIDQVARSLNTNIESGLSNAQIQEVKGRPGFRDNTLTPPTVVPWYVQFFHHQTGLFSLLLWGAAALCFFAWRVSFQTDVIQIEYMYLGVVLSIVTFFTGWFSYYQDASAAAQMKSFNNFSPAECLCIREGKQAKIPASELIVGDLIIIENGDKIPADVRVIWEAGCKVDNSSLTGEPLELKRNAKRVTAEEGSEKAQPLEATNLLFFGTLQVNGNCKGIVIWTGDNTVMGKIAELMRQTKDKPTPIAIEIEHFIHIVSYVAIFLGITFVAIGFAKGISAIDNLVFGIGIIVANVPEGLLATVTLSLTLTSKSMYKRNVLVKNLEAVETLGSTTVIASDKTGTLTMNKMTLTTLYYNGVTIPASEGKNGYDVKEETFCRLCDILALQTKPTFKDDEKNWALPAGQRELEGGDASEKAMVKFAGGVIEKNGSTLKATRKAMPVVADVPFNSKNKYAMSIHDMGEGKPLKLLAKGAPDKIFGICKFIMDNGQIREKTAEDEKVYVAARRALMFNGLRLLAVSECDLGPEYKAGFEFNTEPGEFNFPTAAGIEIGVPCDLVFVGLSALQDPPRPSVPRAVKTCQEASIQVVMVTGDHPDTAEAIARKVNIITGNTKRSLALIRGIDISEINSKIDDNDPAIQAVVITGTELSNMDSKEELIEKLNYKEIVFARTSPQQKLQIVQALQEKKTIERRDKNGVLTITKCKNIVAVTGDGVNDAPALKAANIGVAMQTGSDVAKDSADMVLLDDNFSSIVSGVKEGRLIFDNLKKSIAYTLSSNIPEISPFLLWILISIPLPLSTVLILCIDLGTDMIPAISLAYEGPESNIMLRPPRDADTDRLVTCKLVVFAYLQIGVVQAIAGFFAYFVVLNDYGFDPSILPFSQHMFYIDNLRPKYLDDNGDVVFGGPYKYLVDFVGEIGDNVDGDDIRFLKPCNIINSACHNPEEALKHAQCAFFITIIIVQWADLTCCKTRELSLFDQSMRNGWLNFGLIYETVLGMALCYIPGTDLVFQTRPISFYHWLPSLPFCLFILFYDEVRKYLMRNLGKNNWFWRFTYY